MCLYRAGLFQSLAGVDAPIVTFDANGHYDGISTYLKEKGLLHRDSRILNLYDHYRESSFDDLEILRGPKKAPGVTPVDVETTTMLDSSGAVFSRSTCDNSGGVIYKREYFRRDGSTFAVDETPVDESGNELGRLISLLRQDGQIVRQYSSGAKWYRDWLRELIAGRPAVLLVDSGYASRFVAKLDEPHLVKAAVYHSNHVARAGDPYRGRLTPGRRHIAENPDEWDGIVFLTQQQKQDFIERFGDTNNLFTVNNPRRRLDSFPDPAGRSRKRGVMLCRLEAVKNVQSAIGIIDRVRGSIPDIQLDIFGDGPQREELQRLIDNAGLGANVTLKGYSNSAAEEFETASFSLLTSKFEGQPLTVMESQAKGCPPIAFDIRYGPRDLIQDGVNGYLVDYGDVDAAAQRVIELSNDPKIVGRLGRNAWLNSRRFDDAAVLSAWRETIQTMWSRRSLRTRLAPVNLYIQRLEIHRSGTLTLHGRVRWNARAKLFTGARPGLTLQVMPRSTGAPLAKPIFSAYENDSSVTFEVSFNASEFHDAIRAGNENLDFSVIVILDRCRYILRVPFGSSEVLTRVYPTKYHNVSLREFS